MSASKDVRPLTEQVAAVLGRMTTDLRETHVRFFERQIERHYNGLGVYALCGPSRCGKDHAGAWLGSNTHLQYGASLSWYLCRIASPLLGVPRRELYARRHCYTPKLKAISLAIGTIDPTLLFRMALADSDIITGPRDRRQLLAAKAAGYVTAAIWINREGVKPDPTLEVLASDCEYVLTNPGDPAGYSKNLRDLFETKKVFRYRVFEEDDYE